MTISEPLTVDRWLTALLLADLTLQGLVDDRLYVDLAPASATHPLVILVPPAEDVVTRGNGPTNILFTGDWVLKAVGEDTFESVEPIVERMYDLVHGASGSVAAGSVLACTVEGRIRYTEQDAGRVYRHLGLLVRVLSQ